MRPATIGTNKNSLANALSFDAATLKQRASGVVMFSLDVGKKGR
jgi:hypothetical protein